MAQFRHEKNNFIWSNLYRTATKKNSRIRNFFSTISKLFFFKKIFFFFLHLFSLQNFSSDFLFRLLAYKKHHTKNYQQQKKICTKTIFFYSKSSHRWIEASFSNLPVRKDFEQYLIFGLIFSSFWPTSVFFLMSCIFAFYLR